MNCGALTSDLRIFCMKEVNNNATLNLFTFTALHILKRKSDLKVVHDVKAKPHSHLTFLTEKFMLR